MKIATLALLATVAFPLAAYADSSQPNSSSGMQGQPVTNQGEGTSGMNRATQPGTASPSGTMGAGTTDAGKTGRGTMGGASDSSIPGATNPNEPMGRR